MRKDITKSEAYAIIFLVKRGLLKLEVAQSKSKGTSDE